MFINVPDAGRLRCQRRVAPLVGVSHARVRRRLHDGDGDEPAAIDPSHGGVNEHDLCRHHRTRPIWHLWDDHMGAANVTGCVCLFNFDHLINVDSGMLHLGKTVSD